MPSISVKPTFHDSNKQSCHRSEYLDFEDNIYGERVTVNWHHFLRPEIKFGNSIS
ncbi:riboflavin kinase [Staphylococcus aureus]